MNNEYSTVFYDPDISCSFQHLLCWLTKVPHFHPLWCRIPHLTTDSTISIATVHCTSP